MRRSAALSVAVFRHRAYAWFWLGRVLSTIALFSQSVTLGWQVYALARATRSVEESALLVGLVGLAQFLPLFALTLIAGQSADRHDRRTLLLASVAAQLGCALLLAFEAASAHPSLLAVFALSVLIGAARAFIMPAASSLGPMLVPARLLPRAIAWNSLGMQTGMVAGPLLGGLLCALSVPLAYALSAGLYALALLAFAAIRAHTRPPHNGASRAAMIREGIRYIASNRVVLGAISLDLFAVMLGGVTALLPVYARDILAIGPQGFGLLRAGPAVGGGAMAILLAVRPIERRAGAWMLGAVAMFGLATLVFALSTAVLVSLLALIVVGAADMISVYVRQSLVQIVTPDAMRGRVSAVSSLFISASNELGEFESGVAARLLGPVGAAVLGGLGSVAVTAAWMKLFPELARADRLQPAES